LTRIPPPLLKKLYERQVRISVSNLDLPAQTPGLLKGFFKTVVEKLITPKFDMELEMIYGCDKTSDGRLMAVESRESPINRHPITGDPVWFCNAHNHLRYLRDRRPTQVPEVGMTDVFFGDLGLLEPEECEAIKKASEDSIASIPMEEVSLHTRRKLRLESNKENRGLDTNRDANTPYNRFYDLLG